MTFKYAVGENYTSAPKFAITYCVILNCLLDFSLLNPEPLLKTKIKDKFQL